MQTNQCIIQVSGNKAYLSFEEVLEHALIRVTSDNEKQPIVEQEIDSADSTVIFLPAIHGKLTFEILKQELFYSKTIRL